jgi:hypothetical protein
MAQLPEMSGPSTSYSDPIYDRLESLSQRLTRRIGLVLLALVVIISIAVLLRAYLDRNPEAEFAGLLLKAERESDHDAQTKALQALLANEQSPPFFRARAGIELAQDALLRGALSEAKDDAARALDLAQKSDLPDVLLAAQLSRAAVQEQSGDAAAARDGYVQVEHAAGARYPDRFITAVMGESHCLVLMGKPQDAADALEQIIDRNDEGATALLDDARIQYWDLKRALAKPTAAPAPAAARTATMPPAAPSHGAPAAPAAAPAAAAPTH